MVSDRREPAFDAVAASNEVCRAARAMGFASVGITAARPTDHPEALRQWIQRGSHGEMSWMTELLDQRLDIRQVLPGARSVIVVADRYPDVANAGQTDAQPRGRVARYAVGRDYHDVIRKRLGRLADGLRARWPDSRSRIFVDTGPVLEREQAARAGLGFIGKNTMLIDPLAGSYLLLGGLVTTLELEPSVQSPGSADISHCGTCTRCIDACPTGAISPLRIEATRCISYLTIEHSGPIAAEFHRPIGDWIFGCDICQEVCPFNEHARPAAAGGGGVNAAYRARPALAGGRLDLREVLNWTEDNRRVTLTVSAGKRASHEMMRRNAVIAAANLVERGGHGELRTRLEKIAEDSAEPRLVRRTAAEVIARLNAREADPASD